ncbi:MAG: hypothetical protein MK132_10580 [Lentisphaerales bacterium]|nr:hypothetical protein [Lentisphaerales bacterium]
MRTSLIIALLFTLASCKTTSGDVQAITINEDQLISATGSHPEKVDSLYFNLRKLQRVNLDLQEKLMRVEKIMFEKKLQIGDQNRGIIVAGSARNNTISLVIMLTTEGGIPLAYKEFKKKGILSAIYEVSDSNELEVTWYTGSGNELKKHSFDTFKITADSVN